MASTSATTGGGRERTFETPNMDREAPILLQRISEEGGYAFVGMVARAASGSGPGDLRAAEAAREMAWEQLHSGPWHSVLPIWRDAYSMSCLHVARLHFAAGDFADALRALDMGLIMGGLSLRGDLQAAVDRVRAFNKAPPDYTATAVAVDKARSRFASLNFDQAQVLKVLPLRSLSSKSIVKRSALTLEGFVQDYYLPGFPVIITDAMDHWPACSRWNDFNYLGMVAGDRTVPVEVGKNYLCTEWKQELITFSEFLERIQSTDSSAAPTYLAQHPLFEQIKELRKDFSVPDYCYAGGGEIRSINAWFGPGGTVTPLHHDPHHNIFAQVAGKKYLRLYPASLSKELYPHDETMLCNSSQVDLDNLEENDIPEFKDLEFLDCILGEGEMIYIPPKWWHYVRSLSTSLSVSFWWGTSDGSPSS